MITALIIDDEQRARDLLKKTIEKYCPDVQIMGTGSSVDEAVNLIRTHNPDLVFLDIEMPNGNGFTLFDKIKNIAFDVVFTTAYEEYAIKAFRISALDYLTKPIDYRDLQEAVNKLKNKKKIHLNEQRITLLLENISNRSNEFNKIALPINDGYAVIKISDIVYCEADGNYTNIFLLNGDRIVSSKILKLIEALLPIETFYRIHKSCVVNLNLIKNYNKKDGNIVIMQTGQILDVADRIKKEFLEKLFKK
jgi:two-component system LytT family response regulator